MKVLIACECSGIVREAFNAKGHEATSCDIKPTDRPGSHYQGSVLDIINDGWDLMIAHPPCTYLAVSGNRWLYNKDGSKNTERWQNREEALNFVKILMTAPIPHIAIENPISCISSEIRKPDQIIHPYMFGEPHMKATCLWLKKLPKLEPTNIVDKGKRFTWVDNKTGKTKSQPQWYYDALKLPKEERSKVRSQTFEGIAEAMADQWGNYAELKNLNQQTQLEMKI